MRNVESAATSTSVRGSRRATALWWLIWMVWLPLFFSPAIDLVRAHAPVAQLAASFIGLALFVALYAGTTWRSARRLAGAAPRVPPTPAALWAPIAVMIALSVTLTALDGPAWGALFIYTSTCAAGRLPLRQAAGLILVLVAYTVFGLGTRYGIAAAISPAVFIAIPGFTVMALVVSVTMSQRLRAEREEMARQAAVNEERLRIARDLHDLLGHNLSLIALKSELARRLVGVAPERAATEIADVEQVARQALQDAREAVAGYRQPSLAGELAGAREMLAAAGIAYRFEGNERASRGLPSALDAALAWTVREGVTNVIRHSHARSCTIGMVQDPGEVSIEIADDGAGKSAASSAGAPANRTHGNGLRGLAERVAALGGQCDSGPDAEGGFRLRVRLPLERGAAGERAPNAQPPARVPMVPIAASPALADRQESQTAADGHL